ncbi:MAG TPA: hypothetical protein VJQ26_10210 [Ktedonobacteraceae bacterium]|nr:hypothetical protein [Ktedonobacteraceae bacterium]
MSYVSMPPWGNQGDDGEVQEPSQEDQPIAEEQLAPADSPAAKLPPEAQGEVNGGPLGCCLGVMVGLTLSLVVVVASRFLADPLAQVLHGSLSVVIRIVMIIFAIAGAIIFGYFGWKIGKRFYREYEPPVIKDRRRKSKPREA